MSEQMKPETEMLYEQIVQERAFQKRRNILALVIYAAETFFCLWGSIALLIQGLDWLAFLLFCVSLIFAYQIRGGIKRYRWGKIPISNDEVVLRRQEERMRLFQAAHGQLPSEWRFPTLFIQITLGLLITLYCLWDILHHGFQFGGSALLAVLGLLVCGSTLVEWKRARRLKMEAGAILAERLHAGENSE